MISRTRRSKTTEQERRLQKKVKELSTLYEVSKILTAAMDLDEALSLIVKTTANMMKVKACGVRLLDESNNEMVLKAVYGLSQDYINKGRIFAWKGLYKDVILKGQVAIVKDVATDPRFEYTEAAQEEGIKSMLSVGLLIRGNPIGALSVYTERPHTFTRDQIQIFKGIANEAASVIEKARLYQERLEKQRIEQEIAAAASIQAGLMPQKNPVIPPFQISARNVPSRIIGGDFYDFIPIDEEHIGIVIADVSGKGIPGAILMASARASLRTYLEDPHSVRGAITRLNRVLCRDTQANQFITLFYGMLDIKDKTLTYTNAGHNPPILFRKNRRNYLRQGGLILGVLPDSVYEEGKIRLKKGDILVFYTDGITEAEQDGRFFGVERLSSLVQSNTQKTPDEIIDKVLSEVEKFSSGSLQTDDRTIVVMTRR